MWRIAIEPNTPSRPLGALEVGFGKFAVQPGLGEDNYAFPHDTQNCCYRYVLSDADPLISATREIGVRIALGAGRGDVLRLFLEEGTKLSLSGAVTGVIAALLATRLLRSLLFGVEATDVPIYSGVMDLLLLVALAASLIPAARAASFDPVEALRSK